MCKHSSSNVSTGSVISTPFRVPFYDKYLHKPKLIPLETHVLSFWMFHQIFVLQNCRPSWFLSILVQNIIYPIKTRNLIKRFFPHVEIFQEQLWNLKIRPQTPLELSASNLKASNLCFCTDEFQCFPIGKNCF